MSEPRPNAVTRASSGVLAALLAGLRARVVRTMQDAQPEAPSIHICECEISDPPTVTSNTAYAGQEQVRVLLRLHGQPLAYADLPAADSSTLAQRCQQEALTHHEVAVRAHLAQDGTGTHAGSGIPGPSPACLDPSAAQSQHLTVVVCTRNRAKALEPCLRRILSMRHRDLDLVVVDNAPADGSTEAVVRAVTCDDARVTYVREDRPGLSNARNRGLAHAAGPYVAFTDDDVLVDGRWASALLAGFGRADHVACVTGLVATAALTTASEAYFDARAASWGSRFHPLTFALPGPPEDRLFPYAPGQYGTGANFCLDRRVMDQLGWFDPALGAGTLTRGGEDLDMFVRVIRSGRTLVYEPAALVWHYHRATEEELLRQLYGYGTGLSAYVAKLLLDPGSRYEILRRVLRGARYLVGIRNRTTERMTGSVRAPLPALVYELAGFVSGPFLYLRARRSAGAAVEPAMDSHRVLSLSSADD